MTIFPRPLATRFNAVQPLTIEAVCQIDATFTA
jgi:hypothetical protein